MNAKQKFLVEKLLEKSFSDKYIADILGVATADIAKYRQKRGLVGKNEQQHPRRKTEETESRTKEYSKSWYGRQLDEINDTIERIEKTLFEITDYEKYMQMSNRLSLLLQKRSFIENLLRGGRSIGLAERSALSHTKAPLTD